MKNDDSEILIRLYRIPLHSSCGFDFPAGILRAALLNVRNGITQRLAMLLLFGCVTIPAAAQSGSVYDALVKQSADLPESGNADPAFQLSQGLPEDGELAFY
jgi:hypothetical protein